MTGWLVWPATQQPLIHNLVLFRSPLSARAGHLKLDYFPALHSPPHTPHTSLEAGVTQHSRDGEHAQAWPVLTENASPKN